MKRTILICAAVGLVVVMVFGGVYVVKNRSANPENDKSMMTEFEEGNVDGIMEVDDFQSIDSDEIYSGNTTFEEFCVGLKDDLSPELLEEVRDLYDRWVEAENDDDAKRGAATLMEIYEELVDLDVLTMEEQPSMIAVKPRP